MKHVILDTIDDMVTDFLVYDRKGDPDLPRGKIQEAVKDGTITIEDMIERFKTKLAEGLK